MKRIRASILNDGQICPGKVGLEGSTKSADNPYTAIGKAGHRWLELMVTKGQPAADEYLRESGHWHLHVALLELVEWIEETGLVPPGDRRAEWAFSWSADGDWHTTGTIDLVVIDPPRATVIDWKFYNDPGGLVPMHRDMQMYAYAVGAAKAFDVTHVDVHRVLCYYRSKHSLTLTGDDGTLGLAAEAIVELCERISNNCDSFVVGAQCLSCFQAGDCEVYKSRSVDIDSLEMKPYEGGDFENEAQALRFLLAAPLIYQRLDQGYAAARRIAAVRPITDLVSGRQWGPRETSRDVITNATGCLNELIKVAGQERALAAAGTSKSAMEDAMKKARMRPRRRRAFFERLRELGHIEKTERDPKHAWRRLKNG